LLFKELTGAYESYRSYGSTGRILKFFADDVDEDCGEVDASC